MMTHRNAADSISSFCKMLQVSGWQVNSAPLEKARIVQGCPIVFSSASLELVILLSICKTYYRLTSKSILLIISV